MAQPSRSDAAGALAAGDGACTITAEGDPHSACPRLALPLCDGVQSDPAVIDVVCHALKAALDDPGVSAKEFQRVTAVGLVVTRQHADCVVDHGGGTERVDVEAWLRVGRDHRIALR